MAKGPQLVSHSASTLSEFMSHIEALLKEAGAILWFRGVGKGATHHLTPSMYRHPSLTLDEEFMTLEKRLLQAFFDRGYPFAPDVPRDPMERLFVMQHHRTPTRLLD